MNPSTVRMASSCWGTAHGSGKATTLAPSCFASFPEQSARAVGGRSSTRLRRPSGTARTPPADGAALRGSERRTAALRAMAVRAPSPTRAPPRRAVPPPPRRRGSYEGGLAAFIDTPKRPTAALRAREGPRTAEPGERVDDASACEPSELLVEAKPQRNFLAFGSRFPGRPSPMWVAPALPSRGPSAAATRTSWRGSGPRQIP